MKTPKNNLKGTALDNSYSPHPHGPPGGRSLPLHLAYAIPDHPWIDSADGAAVRIAMTVAALGKGEGILEKVTDERPMEHGECEVSLVKVVGVIAPNLQIGSDLTSCSALQANSDLSSPGMEPHGLEFLVSHNQAVELGLGRQHGLENHIRPYLNGRDVMAANRSLWALDFFGLTQEELADRYPECFQWLLVHIKPHRDQNPRATRKNNWWIFGEPCPAWRAMSVGLSRYMVTVKTTRRRFFSFVDATILPDSKLIAFAMDDAYDLGILSSLPHLIWAEKTGSKLGVGNDPTYVKSVSFSAFPFPALEEGSLKQRIRDLGERLDAHRKRQQEQHPGLTLTGMYNVLEKLRAGEPLTAKDKQIHDQGLVTLLKQIHDELDQAVLEAYGWQDLSANAPHCSGGLRPSIANEQAPSLSSNGIDGRGSAPAERRPPLQASHSPDAHRAPLQNTSSTPSNLSVSASQHFSICPDALLTRLVALNHERAAEEKRGFIRWLRPDYQNCSGGLRPSHDSPDAASDSRGSAPAERRPLLQDELPGTESPSSLNTENLKLNTPAWPERLPDQVTLIRQLLAQDPAATPAQLSARFGRKNAKRTEQIEGIIETLRGLGQV